MTSHKPYLTYTLSLRSTEYCPTTGRKSFDYGYDIDGDGYFPPESHQNPATGPVWQKSRSNHNLNQPRLRLATADDDPTDTVEAVTGPRPIGHSSYHTWLQLPSDLRPHRSTHHCDHTAPYHRVRPCTPLALPPCDQQTD